MDRMECKIHKLAADVLILAKGQVLLVRYKDIRKYDGQGGWFLPEDYLAFAEHPEFAARRILQEQVCLYMGDIALSYIESLGGEDGGAWHLIFHHKVVLDHIPTVTPSTNIKNAEWFPLDNLPQRPFIAYGGRAIDVIRKILK